MTDSASLKIGRAEKHVAEIAEVLRKTQPFTFIVQTNTETGERLLDIEKDETAVHNIALACGDALHNLRSALDHAFWAIVSQNAKHLTEQQQRRIQFPFTSKADELWKTIKDSYAHLSGTGFLSTMRLLRTHGEPERAGNKLLYLVRELDNRDKHKLLVPAVNAASIPSDLLNEELPDLPIQGRERVSLAFADGAKFKWFVRELDTAQLGLIIPPSFSRYKRKLDLPIQVAFDPRPSDRLLPIVPTLYGCVDECRKAITLMREGANTY